jgi:hypothetical protein
MVQAANQSLTPSPREKHPRLDTTATQKRNMHDVLMGKALTENSDRGPTNSPVTKKT